MISGYIRKEKMKNYEELLEQYHPAMFKLIDLDGEAREQRDLYNRRFNLIYSKLIDDKYELDKIARDKQSVLDNNLKKFEAEIKKEREQPSQIVRTVNRILSFIGIAMTKHGEMEIAPTIYRDQKWVYIDTLADDKMKVIKVYVYSNDNRVNKCTIAALGHTIFNSEVIEVPYSYGIPLDQTNNIPFGSKLNFWGGYYPTVAAATKSFDGRRNNMRRRIKEFIVEHEKVEKEYQQLRYLVDDPRWMLLYWKKEKRYYENNVSHGTTTEEYRKIIEEITKITEEAISEERER